MATAMPHPRRCCVRAPAGLRPRRRRTAATLNVSAVALAASIILLTATTIILPEGTFSTASFVVSAASDVDDGIGVGGIGGSGGVFVGGKIGSGGAGGSSSSSCGLYLAPSSTNSEEDEDDDFAVRPPRLGLYAGRDYVPSEVIGRPEIAIQIYDLEAHTGRSVLRREEKGEIEEEDRSGDDEESEEDLDERKERALLRVRPENVNYFRYAITQMWSPDSTGAKYDTSEFVHSFSPGTKGGGGPGGWEGEGPGRNEPGGHTYTAIPGVGTVGRFHPGIVNADWNQDTCLNRSPSSDSFSSAASLEGYDHPGRGAYSEYYDVTVRATDHIPRGMEIFMDFGTEWSEENREEGSATAEDYVRADKSIDAVLGFLEKYEDNLSPELSKDVYRFLIDEVVPLGSESEERAEVQRSLLPKDVTKLKAVKETGGALRHANPHVFRDLDWLEEHGQCADNLYAAPSTIPFAGRGAFASRRIAKGELVTPMPLVHIPHGRELDTYELEGGIHRESDEEVLVRAGGKDAKPEGKQLLINYCFGHPQSNVLLYPFGTASNFINHQSGGRANAKIVWSGTRDSSSSSGSSTTAADSTNSRPGPKRGKVQRRGTLKVHRPEWLEVSPFELNLPGYDAVGLAFDVIATRDIRPGEEVFLDYGPEWQNAWEEHVAKFENKEKEEGGGNGGEKRKVEKTALELNALYHGRATSSASNPSSESSPKGDAATSKGEIRPFLIPDELRSSPYPTRVTTACHVKYREIDEKKDNIPLREMYREGIKVYQWTDEKKKEGDEDGAAEGDVWKGASMRLCEVLERRSATQAEEEEEEGEEDEKEEADGNKSGGGYLYTVRIVLEEGPDGLDSLSSSTSSSSKNKKEGAALSKIVRGVPHAAVKFVDRPYEGDQHRTDAFRHYIGIPDDMFPVAWRDRR